MGGEGTSRHLGLDLGATNLKWAVLETDGHEWRRLDTGQVPTDGEDIRNLVHLPQ